MLSLGLNNNKFKFGFQGIEDTLYEEMLAAGEEEKRIAIEKGRVCRNPDGSPGFPWIAVVVDGSWGTRSHGHKYSSKGGMAGIVGVETKKLLYYGVRNKYCVICARAGLGPVPTHECHRNWEGSSTAMETDIIVKGFQESERMHGLQFLEVIGDGDSSVHKNILTRVSYGRRVRKIECANHVTKCYTTGLYKVAKENAETRRLLSVPRIKRMTVTMRTIIKHHALASESGDRASADCARDLAADAGNASLHVLGHHEKCKSFYCNVAQNPETVANAMKCHIPEKVRITLAKVADVVRNKATKLVIYDVTSNLAETLMSRIAKTIGGKRVNHYQKRGYHNRCAAACLSYQVGPSMHVMAYKKTFTRSPSKVLKNFVSHHEKRQKNKNARETRAYRNKHRYQDKKQPAMPDGDYGPHSNQPDLEETEPSVFEARKQAYMESITLSDSEREALRQATAQEKDKWFEARKGRITASSVHAITNMRKTTSGAKVIDQLLYDAGKDVDTDALHYGRVNETLAISQYEKEMGCKVTHPTGLIVHKNYPFIAATPDGFVGEEQILEVKCPKVAEKRSIVSLAKGEDRLKTFCLDENMKLKRTHPYFSQVQCQLACTGARCCDFYVWSPNCEAVRDRIYFDEEFWASRVDKIKLFFYECVLPEIVDPRKCRNMAFRERASYTPRPATPAPSSVKRKLD